jgi:hypothetical protein
MTSELRPDELLFYKEGDNIMSGGYSINSLFLNDGISPMKTLNSLENDQTGGKKISSIFDNLAVPAGLFLINQNSFTGMSNLTTNKYKNSEMLPDNIFDEFMKMIEVDKKNKRGKRKTKKLDMILSDSKHKKTRKNLDK